MTPASTVAARMLSYQALLNQGEAESIIADSLGLTLADAPEDSLFASFCGGLFDLSDLVLKDAFAVVEESADQC